MGIPSYFKHILDRYPRLLKPSETSGKADVLLVDFNCLIYGCIRGPKLPAYTAATKDAWEAAAIRAVEEYVVHIWRSAGQPARVLLAVDGVVPMAKMRQQRMRRFKSVWLAGKEREMGVRTGESWDTNAITPGTEFMERLATALRRLATARGVGWTVSAADEPGEGEQKCMSWARPNATELVGKRVWVYGLDADLIVLSLLHSVDIQAQWSIFRERMEFGSSARGVPGTTSAEFLSLDVNGLAAVLWPNADTRRAAALSYVCGMSLLGNDFLPHSLGMSIRGGGHDVLMRLLDSGITLTEQVDGFVRVCRSGLLALLNVWSETEEADIASALERKYTARGPPPRTDAERAMLPVQNLPLEWAAEKAMWKRGEGLHEGWQSTYYSAAVGITPTKTDIWRLCSVWCEGLQWILDYYTGQRPVNYAWSYSWLHTPLWSDLIAYISATELLPQPPDAAADSPVQPQEQLTLVLPLESWGLIRDATLRGIPARIPAYWPAKFGFHSFGKRWFWECEASIPILSPARLRAVLGDGRTYRK